MKRFVSPLLSFFICFCLLIATAHQAWGYVDPGSGLLAMQSIASVAAAFGYFLRRRIRNLFMKPATSEKDAMTVGAKEGSPAKAA